MRPHVSTAHNNLANLVVDMVVAHSLFQRLVGDQHVETHVVMIFDLLRDFAQLVLCHFMFTFSSPTTLSERLRVINMCKLMWPRALAWSEHALQPHVSTTRNNNLAN